MSTQSRSTNRYIVFGSYEQDGNKKNGKEPIEWEVLKEDKNGILVISRYVLDYQPYSKKPDVGTWEACSLRKWLNKKFYSKAFNTKEQKKINTVKLKNDDNSFWNADGGKDTKDKIFFLSYNEIVKLYDLEYEYEGSMGYSQDLLGNGTGYALNLYKSYWINKGGRTEADINDYWSNFGSSFAWWTRSVGDKDVFGNYTTCFVTTGGGVSEGNSMGVLSCGGVRPALYLKNS